MVFVYLFMSKALALLGRLLRKRGIKSSDDLSGDERNKWDQWRRVLSQEDIVTIEQVKEYLTYQVNEIHKKLDNLDNSPLKNEKLVTILNVYLKLEKALAAPRVEREALEKYLNQLINE